jgi:hypothetical protein
MVNHRMEHSSLKKLKKIALKIKKGKMWIKAKILIKAER